MARSAPGWHHFRIMLLIQILINFDLFGVPSQRAVTTSPKLTLYPSEGCFSDVGAFRIKNLKKTLEKIAGPSAHGVSDLAPAALLLLSFFSSLVRACEAAPGTLLAKNTPLGDQPRRQNRPYGAPRLDFLDFLVHREGV